MPVFHTKTIEAILEPVAQQVSQLVILYEEGEAGSAMPDLSAAVQGVGAAVANLVAIGRQMAGTSKDQILKQEMPVAFKRVEESAKWLVESAGMLKGDPHSKEARTKLINGARGILSGTSTLLLTFDDAEVRKILRQCKAVLEYLVIGEMVESMPDLVTFVKNLTPGITAMAKDVEARSKELTHRVHADILIKNLTDVKELTPLLIAAMKTFVMTLEKGGTGRAEAQECRNYTIMRMHDDIAEIMRVLQLKIYDEEEAEDPTTEMRKAQGIMKGKMDMARDWLNNPSADAHGLGERALRDVINQAQGVAEASNDPRINQVCGELDQLIDNLAAYRAKRMITKTTTSFQFILTGERALRDVINQARGVAEASNDPRINQVCGELDQLIDNLAAYRAKGMGNSPEALQLSREIGNRLQYLQALVDDAIAREAGSGMKLPAPTTAGRVDQALNWINDPKSDPKGVGRRAVSALVMDGRKMAEELSGAERQELLQTSDKVERLTKELADLKAKGMGNTPQAQAIAKQLSAEVDKLKGLLQKVATRAVVENFMDTAGPIKKLERAANAPPGAPNREKEFEEQAGAFEYASQKMVDTALQVASSGKSTSKELKEALRAKAKEVQAITPQVSHAAKILLLNPNDPTALAYFNNVRDDYNKMMGQLVGLVDNATDAADFIQESEEAIKRDTEAAVMASKQQNPQMVVVKSGNIARRCNRIVQVANAEVENSEDPEFKDKVTKAAANLDKRVKPLILYAQSVAKNPNDKKAQDDFTSSTKDVEVAVAEVRKAFIPEKVPDVAALSLEEAPPRPPPPRPPLPVEDVIQAQDAQEVEAVLKEPPADNRMAVAAHHLHAEVNKWEEEGNAIISAAKRMALLFAKMSRFISDDDESRKLSKKDLIDTAKLIAVSSEEVVRRAREVANKCPDRRLKNVLLQTVERIPTIGTQLKILATVKATMFGARDEKADQEATEMLVGCAENLMSAVRQTVKETEAASVKIRAEAGQGGLQWKRQARW